MAKAESSKVIQFRPRATEPEEQIYVHGTAKCMKCHHKWEAQITEENDRHEYFDCPECGMKKASWVMPYQLAQGEKYWVCKCGNDKFQITEHNGAFCQNCDTYQKF